MQEELRKGDYPWDSDGDLQKESLRHKHLLEAIDSLKVQLPILKEKIKGARICGPGNTSSRITYYNCNIFYTSNVFFFRL